MKKSASGCLGALFSFIFYIYYWIFILIWWMIKYTCLAIWWLLVILVNAIIALIEFIINFSKGISDIMNPESESAIEQSHENIE